MFSLNDNLEELNGALVPEVLQPRNLAVCYHW
jgi:hypothetical protein